MARSPLEDAQASTPGGTPPPKPGARGILCRWRGGTGPADFCLPGGKEHGAQRECSLPWKRSFCSSEQDRNKTLSCRVPPATRLLAASIFGSDSLDFSHAPGLYTGAGLGFPDRLRVLPAPDVPGTMSKPKGKPRKYQDGPSSCAGTRSGGEMGISWTLVWLGGGDYRRLVHGRGTGSTRRQTAAICNATCSPPEAARLKQDDKTAID